MADDPRSEELDLMEDVHLDSESDRYIGNSSNQLSFQDIPHSDVHVRIDTPEEVSHQSDTLLNDGTARTAPVPDVPVANPSVFSMAYYRTFFDFSSRQIGERMLRALWPFGRKFYTEEDSKPDMYGPFWVTTTLIFLMAATANLADYFNSSGEWKYDFRKMTVAAPVFYCYISVIPVIMWFLLRKAGRPMPLSQVISLFGYSLLIYTPTCVLSVVPLNALRWLFVALSFFISTTFLVRNMWPTSTEETPVERRQYVIAVLVFLALGQCGIALVTKFYFFSYPD